MGYELDVEDVASEFGLVRVEPVTPAVDTGGHIHRPVAIIPARLSLTDSLAFRTITECIQSKSVISIIIIILQCFVSYHKKKETFLLFQVLNKFKPIQSELLSRII